MASGAPHRSRPKVAVVLGSGSMKSCASIGLWKVLQRESIPVDMLVGCSGGGMFAAGFALGFSVERVTRYAEMFTREMVSKYNFSSVLKALFPRLLRFDETVGMVNDRRLVENLRTIYGDNTTFEDCPIPLLMVATDIRSGETVVLSEGKIFDAVRASASVPILWQPWKVGDRLLFDGGASNPLPIDVAIREQAGVIVAMGFEDPMLPSIASLADLARQTSFIVQSRLLQANYGFYTLAHHSELIPIMPRFGRPIGLAASEEIPFIIDKGEEAAEEQIPYLKRLLNQSASELAEPT